METTLAHFYMQNKAWFLPYLWGMETFLNITLKNIKSWFLPYLWGMETKPSAYEQNKKVSSYRTYEEWKLHIITSFFAAL